MPDTQWPRYLVFEQDFHKNPHRLAGSVHAPDAELALFNARDVFVRRPTVVSLWIVRADSVFSKTVEELAAHPGWADDLSAPDSNVETWLVFGKLHHKRPHEHIGEVQAADAPCALQKAIEQFGDEEPVVWWVLPRRLVYRTTPEDIELMFEQAKDKPFRHQSNFRVQTRLRQIMEESENDE